MKKLIARVLIFTHILYSMAAALSGITVPNTFTSGAKIYASEFNENFDSLETFTSHIADTLDNKYMKWTDLSSGDSTLQRLQVDTIRSNPDVDSLAGNPFIDTVTTRRVVADSVIGPLRGTVITANGPINTGTGDITTDSIALRTVTGLSLDEIEPLNADKTFNNAAYSTSFNFTNPSGQPTYDGAFEIQASGAFTGDLFHVHQHTGNPGTSDLSHFHAEDNDVVVCRLQHDGTGNALEVGAEGAPVLTINQAGNMNTGTADITTDSVYLRTLKSTATLLVDSLASTKAVRANLVGNVTGNASGTAATVTGAAQSAITSVGTLTGLTMGGNITTGTNDIITDSTYARTVVVSGNLGVGATSSQCKLQVEAAGATVVDKDTYGQLTINTPSTEVGAIDKGVSVRFRLNNNIFNPGYHTTVGVIRSAKEDANNYTDASPFYMAFHTSSNVNQLGAAVPGLYERMRITSGGKIGIDTTSPTEKLYVNRGNVKADTIKGAITTGNLNIATGTGDVNTDSVYARTITLNNGAVNTGTGDITTDSTYARTARTSGAAAVGGNLSVAGYTTFGTGGTALKSVVLTDSTGAAEGASIQFDISGYAGKVVSIDVLIREGITTFFPNSTTAEEIYTVNAVSDMLAVNLHATSSGSLLNGRITVLIWLME